MTTLGLALAIAAVQVTVAGIVAVVVVRIASRRSPQTAVALAGASLGLCSLLTAAAIGPLPRWWTWETSLPSAALPAAASPDRRPQTPLDGPSPLMPLRRLKLPKRPPPVSP